VVFGKLQKANNTLNNDKYSIAGILILVAFLCMLPVVCSYFMDGGVILAELPWLCDKTDIAIENGKEILFVYRSYIVLNQLVSVLVTFLLFKKIVGDSIASVAGVALIMSLPTRVYMIFDLQSVRLTILYTLVLVLLCALRLIIQVIEELYRKSRFIEAMACIIIAGLLAAVVIKWHVSYEMLDGLKTEYEIPNLFGAFVYPDAMPGSGMALIVLLVLGVYCLCIWHEKMDGIGLLYINVGLLCWIMSLNIPFANSARGIILNITHVRIYPFEMVHIGSMCLSISLVKYVHETGLNHTSEWQRKVAWLLISVMGIANAIYLCNMLTYNRLPL
jgi:hypothetical protein